MLLVLISITVVIRTSHHSERVLHSSYLHSAEVRMLVHPAVYHGTGTESVRSEEIKSACQLSVTGPSGSNIFFFFFRYR